MARQLTNRQAKRSRKSKGFTLIELMVVTAIAGVLGAIAVPKFLQARESSVAKAAVAEVVGAGRECQTYLSAGAADGGMTQPTIKITGTAAAIPCTDGAQYALTLSSSTFTQKVAADQNGEGAVSGTTCLGTENDVANAKTVTVTANQATGLTCTFSA